MAKIADTLEPGDIRLNLLKLGMFGVVVLGVGQRHNATTRTGSRPIETQIQGEDQNSHFVPDRTRPEGVTYIPRPEVFLTFPALHSTLQRTQQGNSQSTRQKHLLRATVALWSGDTEQAKRLPLWYLQIKFTRSRNRPWRSPTNQVLYSAYRAVVTGPGCPGKDLSSWEEDW